MFDDALRDHAQLTPRAPAVVAAARAWSYAEFNADIDRFGAALAAADVIRPGAVVSICLDTPYLNYVALVALARLRVTSSPYNDPGADLRLVEDRAGAGTDHPGPALVALDRAWLAATLAAEPRPLPILPPDPDGLARVVLSSGTTQTPRRIGVSWRAAEAINISNLSTRGAGVGGVWAPLTTVESMQGYSLAMSAWSTGLALTTAIRAPAIPALMEAWASGLVGCTPTLLRAVLAALPPGFTPKPGWRISAGGARLPLALAAETRLRITPDLRVSYGATEAPGSAHGFAAGLEDDPGQVGAAVGGAIVEILGDDGRPVPEGETGEIRIRSDRMASGYLGDPEATAERFRDGWFHTRDVGRRLPDGRLVLDGRLDERMNLGGVKFMPAVLEEAALACAGVRDAAAFAVPGPSGLDVCWLAVTAEADFDRASLAPHLAAYPKLPPPRFAWVEEIPRNAMGKVERAKLRDALVAATRGRG